MPVQVFISCANGKTGYAVTRALVARAARVRGLVRQSAHFERLQAIGAEAVLGDLEDPASLVAAAAGCNVVMHIGPPMDPREVEATQAMLAAANAANAGQFIYYSVMQPLRQDVEHHRRKLLAEARVVESGIPYTLLQPIRYMQHLEPIWNEVRQNGVHAMPFNTREKFNVVDLEDLAQASAIVATDPGHLWATYELAGPEALSQDDMASRLSELLGRPVTARAISPEHYAAAAKARGFSAERIGWAQTMNRHYDAHGFRGNPNILRWLLGREPTSYQDYVRRLMTR